MAKNDNDCFLFNLMPWLRNVFPSNDNNNICDDAGEPSSTEDTKNNNNKGQGIDKKKKAGKTRDGRKIVVEEEIIEEVLVDQDGNELIVVEEEIIVEEEAVVEEIIDEEEIVEEIEEEVVEDEDEEEEVLSESSYADQVVESWAEVIEEEPEDLEAAVSALIAVVYKDEPDVDVESMLRRTRLPELYKYLKSQYWYKIHTNKEENKKAAQVVQEKPSEIVSVDDMLKGRLQGLIANVQQRDHNPQMKGSQGGDKQQISNEAALEPGPQVNTATIQKLSAKDGSQGNEGGHHVAKYYEKAVDNRVQRVPKPKKTESLDALPHADKAKPAESPAVQAAALAAAKVAAKEADTAKKGGVDQKSNGENTAAKEKEGAKPSREDDEEIIEEEYVEEQVLPQDEVVEELIMEEDATEVVEEEVIEEEDIIEEEIVEDDDDEVEEIVDVSEEEEVLEEEVIEET